MKPVTSLFPFAIIIGLTIAIYGSTSGSDLPSIRHNLPESKPE